MDSENEKLIELLNKTNHSHEERNILNEYIQKIQTAFMNSEQNQFLDTLLNPENNHINRDIASDYYGIVVSSLLKATKTPDFYSYLSDKLNQNHLFVIFTLLHYCHKAFIYENQYNINHILTRAHYLLLIQKCNEKTLDLLFDLGIEKFNVDIYSESSIAIFNRSILVLFSDLPKNSLNSFISKKLDSFDHELQNFDLYKDAFFFICELLHQEKTQVSLSLKSSLFNFIIKHKEIFKTSEFKPSLFCFPISHYDSTTQSYIPNKYFQFLANMMINEIASGSNKTLLCNVLVDILSTIGFVKSFDYLYFLFQQDQDNFNDIFDSILFSYSNKYFINSSNISSRYGLYSISTILSYVLPLFIQASFKSDSNMILFLFTLIQICAKQNIEDTIILLEEFQFLKLIENIPFENQIELNQKQKIKTIIDLLRIVNFKELPPNFDFNSYQILELIDVLSCWNIKLNEKNYSNFYSFIIKEENKKQIMECSNHLCDFFIRTFLEFSANGTQNNINNLKDFMCEIYDEFDVLLANGLSKQNPDYIIRYFLRYPNDFMNHVIMIDNDIDRINLLINVLDRTDNLERFTTSLQEVYFNKYKREKISNFGKILNLIISRIKEGAFEENFAYFASNLFLHIRPVYQEIEPYINEIMRLAFDPVHSYSNYYLITILIHYRKFCVKNNLTDKIKQFDNMTDRYLYYPCWSPINQQHFSEYKRSFCNDYSSTLLDLLKHIFPPLSNTSLLNTPAHSYQLKEDGINYGCLCDNDKFSTQQINCEINSERFFDVLKTLPESIVSKFLFQDKDKSNSYYSFTDIPNQEGQLNNEYFVYDLSVASNIQNSLTHFINKQNPSFENNSIIAFHSKGFKNCLLQFQLPNKSQPYNLIGAFRYDQQRKLSFVKERNRWINLLTYQQQNFVIEGQNPTLLLYATKDISPSLDYSLIYSSETTMKFIEIIGQEKQEKFKDHTKFIHINEDN